MILILFIDVKESLVGVGLVSYDNKFKIAQLEKGKYGFVCVRSTMKNYLCFTSSLITPCPAVPCRASPCRASAGQLLTPVSLSMGLADSLVAHLDPIG